MIATIEHRVGRPEYRGMWNRLVKVRDVLRPDGRYGTAEITGEADTYFTVPARMSIDGRKVGGWVSTENFGKSVLPPEVATDDMARLLDGQINNGWDLAVWVFYPKAR